MSVILTVILNDPPRSLTEYRSSVEDAAQAVSDMADRLGAEIQAFDLSTFGHQGRFLRNKPTGLPITITEVIGSYEIEES